jgi:hypothetical protein
MLKCILEKKTIPSLLSKRNIFLVDMGHNILLRNKSYVSISTHSLSCLIQIIELSPSQPEMIELKANL